MAGRPKHFLVRLPSLRYDGIEARTIRTQDERCIAMDFAATFTRTIKIWVRPLGRHATAVLLVLSLSIAARAADNEPPPGFTASRNFPRSEAGGPACGPDDECEFAQCIVHEAQ